MAFWKILYKYTNAYMFTYNYLFFTLVIYTLKLCTGYECEMYVCLYVSLYVLIELSVILL